MRLFLCLLSVLLISACADAQDADVVPVADAPRGVLDEMQLLDRLPETVGGLERVLTNTKTEGALGQQIARASGSYTNSPTGAGPFAAINLMDLGNADMVDRMGFGWALAGVPDTTVAGFPAKTGDRLDAYAIQVVVGERFLIEAVGEAVPTPDLVAAIEALGLDGLVRIAAE